VIEVTVPAIEAVSVTDQAPVIEVALVIGAAIVPV